MLTRMSLISIVVLLLAVGCRSEPEPAESNDGPSVATAPRTAPSNASRTTGATSTQQPEVDNAPLIEKPRLTGQSTVPGNGLETVIFATTREEYLESLSMIAEATSDEQYQQLDAALRWLMINDASIMNDEVRLFELINGKTGAEVLELTAQQVLNRGG